MCDSITPINTFFVTIIVAITVAVIVKVIVNNNNNNNKQVPAGKLLAAGTHQLKVSTHQHDDRT